MEDERDDEGGADGDQAVDEPRAQLTEMLDQRRLFPGGEPPRNDPAHAS